MNYKRVRKTHPYAIENNLRAWSIYHEVWEGTEFICECFEVRPLMWYAIDDKRIITGKSRIEVASRIKNLQNLIIESQEGDECYCKEHDC